MFPLIYWILQLAALVAGIALLIVGLVRKSKVMLIIGMILVALLFLRPLLQRLAPLLP